MFAENSTHAQSGCIEVITGCMFSGKTEELIRRVRRAVIARQKVVIFKSAIDKRYSKEDIVSHDANTIKSVPVTNPADILAAAKDFDVIGIDEAQFFGQKLVDVCEILANQGKRVIVAGLDLDFLGNPFGPMPALISIAEFVTKVHAICVCCGNLAHYSFRTKKNKSQIMLGSEETYEPLCRKCYQHAIKGTKS
jgi:thymidine kinase